MIDYLVGISYGDFDDKITASSEYNKDHSVKGCKLNKTMKNGHASSWCAAGSDMENPWIQVDLGSEYLINAVSLQGRGDAAQWVTRFRIRYSLTSENDLRNLDEFEGNKDNTSVVKRYFRELSEDDLMPDEIKQIYQKLMKYVASPEELRQHREEVIKKFN